MPRPLPALYEQGEEPPPDTRDPVTIAQEQLVEKVRQWTEFITNGDPGNFLDYATYRIFQEWAGNKEALAVMEGIIEARLALPYPYNHKALILAQLIPEDHLSGFADVLKPLTVDPPEDTVDPTIPFINSLAKALHSTASAKATAEAEAKKAAEEQAKQDEELKKWQAWSGMYGHVRPPHEWRTHPSNPEWSFWVWQETSPEEWWVVRKEDAK